MLNIDTPALNAIVRFFQLPAGSWAANPFGSGLINATYLLSAAQVKPRYILQEFNTAVFVRPQDIDANIKLISASLHQRGQDYLFTHPVGNPQAQTLFQYQGKHWLRLFEFIEGTLSVDTVDDATQAYEAASQFGRFDRQLTHVPLESIIPSIPDFHNLTLREQQFATSLRRGNPQRTARCTADIAAIQAQATIGKQLRAAMQSGELKPRLMHHDTKISNVLFDAATRRGVCVVDLDTVMPGTYLSDVGDMMRTYLCPVNENHVELDDISVRCDVYHAIEHGFFDGMGNVLDADERKHFKLAGAMMIYMQALRFLTDHFNNDAYYGARTPDQNLMRARNQIRLLQRYNEL